MDITELKEALSEDQYAALETYVSDLEGQRDSARQESIKGRKGLKAEVETLQAQNAALMEKLGIEDFEELDGLDTQGAAEVNKQLETKLKRAEREREAAVKAAEEAAGKFRDAEARRTVGDALAGYEFLSPDLVRTYINGRVVWEGDDLLYRTDGGDLIPVKDGVAAFAKARPETLKAQGSRGAGVRNAGGGDEKTMTRADFEQLSPAKQAEFSLAGGTLQ